MRRKIAYYDSADAGNVDMRAKHYLASAVGNVVAEVKSKYRSSAFRSLAKKLGLTDEILSVERTNSNQWRVSVGSVIMRVTQL